MPHRFLPQAALLLMLPFLGGLSTTAKWSSDYGGCSEAYSLAKLVSERGLDSVERSLVEPCLVARVEYYRRVVQMVRTDPAVRRELLHGDHGIDVAFRSLLGLAFNQGPLTQSSVATVVSNHGRYGLLAAAPLMGEPSAVYSTDVRSVRTCAPCGYYLFHSSVGVSGQMAVERVLGFAREARMYVVTWLIEASETELVHAYALATTGWSTGNSTESDVRQAVFAALDRRGDLRRNGLLLLDSSLPQQMGLPSDVGYRSFKVGEVDLHLTVAGYYLASLGIQ